MSLVDRYGLPLTASTSEAAAAYVDGLDRLISYDGGVEERLRTTLLEAPDFALARAALAILRWQQRRHDEAVALIEQASAASASLSLREQQQLAVVASVIEGHGQIDDDGRQVPNPELLRLAHQHLKEFPRDALVLLLLTIETIFCGDIREKRRTAALYERLAPSYPDDWWFPAWRASCVIELGHPDAARTFVETAHTANRSNPIAAHAITHLDYEARSCEEGASFLLGWLDRYPLEGQYHSHITWHIALLDLLGGRPERALDTYRRGLDPAVAPPMRTTIEDSVNFLWLLRLYHPEAERDVSWASACAHAHQVAHSAGAPLRDVFAGVAYIGGGERQALESLRADWRRLAGLHPAAADLVLRLLDGMEAFAVARYEHAVTLLEPLMPVLFKLGGSNQQRDMFEDTLADARRRARGAA